jgi:hypothetical protein
MHFMPKKFNLAINKLENEDKKTLLAFVISAFFLIIFFVFAITLPIGGNSLYSRLFQKAHLHADTPLRWSPPELTNPITITLGTGATSNTLDPTRDYIINFPATKKTGYTWLTGGHNIIIKGGHLTTPTGYTNTSERRAIYIKDATGTVHIEGVLIDSSGGGEHDAFAINAPLATVQLQNIRILDLQGTVNSEHSDIIQPWGGVAELRVDRMTGTTNYQGFYFVQTQPTGFIGPVIAQNVNFTHQFNPSQNVPRMLYMVDDSCASHPTSISFTDVYFTPHASRSFSQDTYPSTTLPVGCTASNTNGILTWPGVPWITGSITSGNPPGGDFVPDGAAGIGYASPGYVNDPTATPTPVPVLATIETNPSSQSVSVGDNFTVDVNIAGNGQAFNAAQADVAVSANIEIVSLSEGDCNLSFTSGTTPTVSNPGFAGAILSGSSLSCTAYTLTLKSVSEGIGTVTISNGSVKAYSDSSEIFASSQNGTYTAANPTSTPSPTGTPVPPTATPTLTLTPTATPVTPTSTPSVTPTPISAPLPTFDSSTPEKTYQSTLILSGVKDYTISQIFVNGTSSDVTYPTSTTWSKQITLTDVTYPTSTTWSKQITLTEGANSFTIYGIISGGSQSQTTSTTITRNKLADINGDNTVDLTDLSLFGADWGKSRSNLLQILSDMNNDAVVDLTDFSILAKAYGT